VGWHARALFLRVSWAAASATALGTNRKLGTPTAREELDANHFGMTRHSRGCPIDIGERDPGQEVCRTHVPRNRTPQERIKRMDTYASRGGVERQDGKALNVLEREGRNSPATLNMIKGVRSQRRVPTRLDRNTTGTSCTQRYIDTIKTIYHLIDPILRERG
jgi:hypothetical protein